MSDWINNCKEAATRTGVNAGTHFVSIPLDAICLLEFLHDPFQPWGMYRIETYYTADDLWVLSSQTKFEWESQLPLPQPMCQLFLQRFRHIKRFSSCF